MKKSAREILHEEIGVLQLRRVEELQLLKDELKSTYESLRFVNLVKTAIHDVSESPEIRQNLLNGAVGAATGFVSKKLLSGSKNPILNLIGVALQFGVSHLVTHNMDSIKERSATLFDRLSKNFGSKRSANTEP